MTLPDWCFYYILNEVGTISIHILIRVKKEKKEGKDNNAWRSWETTIFVLSVLGKLLNLCVSWFPHLENGDYDSILS